MPNIHKKLYVEFKKRDFNAITEGMVGEDCQSVVDEGLITRGSGMVLFLKDKEGLFSQAYGPVNIANRWFK
jgi:hypothetical protein